MWLPERLFDRLVHAGRAYELHTLPMLGGPEPVRLNALRCGTLVDELDFLGEMLNDPAARSTARTLADYLASRLRKPSWTGLVTIEGP